MAVVAANLINLGFKLYTHCMYRRSRHRVAGRC
jgi:hypothetical protein